MNNHLGTIQALLVLFHYRRRLIESVAHDVRQRYVGSLLGSLWVFVYPAAQLLIYAGLYVYILRVRPNGLTESGYLLLVFSGLVPLMAFNEAVTAATASLSTHKGLLLNAVFPAELIPPRAALAAQASSAIALLLTLAFGLATDRTGWMAFLVAPLLWVLLSMFAIGLGWGLALLSLVARDLQHGLGLLMMPLFALSPFAYTPEMVPPALEPFVFLNPLSYFVLAFQQVICYNTWPDVVSTCGVISLSVATFFTGFTVFRRAKHVFFEHA